MGSCGVFVGFIVVATLICAATNAEDHETSEDDDGFVVVEICVPLTSHIFELNFLCEKMLMTILAHGIDSQTSCVATSFQCQANGTVRATEYSFVNGVERKPRLYTLEDKKGGVLDLKYDDQPRFVYDQYVFSYTDNNGCVKLTWVQCPDGIGSPSQISILSDCLTDTTDEWNRLNERYPNKSMLQLPNTCKPGQYFPGV